VFAIRIALRGEKSLWLGSKVLNGQDDREARHRVGMPADVAIRHVEGRNDYAKNRRTPTPQQLKKVRALFELGDDASH
jgi:hypothetical protein